MPKVDINRLKGNFGASYVSTRLSSECLVRPVAADTDVGVDLYCETIDACHPFLHFFVQVKSGKQCKINSNLSKASCYFSKDQLEYWKQQPVPVFIALVPANWPVKEDPPVYIIDLTSQLLVFDTIEKGMIFKSDYKWCPGERKDVESFLQKAIPLSTARMQCRNGIIDEIQTPVPKYERTIPIVPVAEHKDKIFHKIRKTAAFSIIFLYYRNEITSETDEFRHTMAGVLEKYDNDLHYENFMARAISQHADRQFKEAEMLYEQALKIIRDDHKKEKTENWIQKEENIEFLLKNAKNKTELKNLNNKFSE